MYFVKCFWTIPGRPSGPVSQLKHRGNPLDPSKGYPTRMPSSALRVAFGFALGLWIAAGGCAAPGVEPRSAAPAAPADPAADGRVGVRRSMLLQDLRTNFPADFSDANPLGGLLRADEYEGALDAGRAIEAFASGDDLKSLLFAQAAVGADPGNTARRSLLHWISKKTGVRPDPEGELPRRALLAYELSAAGGAFFEERFGEALQRARRAILLDESSAEAWKRKASAELALKDEGRARASYKKARELDPDDERLDRFLSERGWLSQ